MANPVPVFVLFMDEQGNRTWNSKLPVPLLNLALDFVKQDILSGRTKEQSTTIVPPSNGETQAVNRVRP